MLDNILLGRFIPSDSVIHALDPRAKLLAVIAFFFVVFQANSPIDYMLLFVFLFVTLLLTRLNIGFFWRGLQPMLWLIGFTAFFQILFISSGEVYWQFEFLKVTSDGISQAIVVTCRFIIIIGMSTILSLTTNPLMIADAIESMLKPFERFKVPAHEIALILSIAMRFVPTILDETKTIMNAQRSRGVDFNNGSILKRVKAVIPILIPLFASAIRRADELANAMEARGYRGGDNRTKYRQLKWQFQDTLVFIVLFGLNALIWIF